MTSAPVGRCINEILPEEVFGVIFEEHAKLEWRAPVIDGRVCHQWRQTILRSPRAWAYLKILRCCKPTPSQLRQWLGRSGSVPLHVQLMEWILGTEEILDPHCKRIKSMALHGVFLAFLNNRVFPILHSLTIKAWYRNPRVIHWDACIAMPELRSLRASNISVGDLPLNIFPPLRVLTLDRVRDCENIIRNSSHSLTSLMIGNISFQHASESLEFPSLRFLSLFSVMNIKHRMNVPALITYHESGRTEEESFPMSLPILIEYGIRRIIRVPFLNVTKLHQCYPNISRLSVRAQPSAVKPFLHSLSGQPTALPMLSVLAVGEIYGLTKYSGEDKDSMRKDVLMRNMASNVKMEFYFDGRTRAPLYFAYVRVCINAGRSKLTSTLRTQIFPIEDLSFGSRFVASLLNKGINMYILLASASFSHA